MVYAEMLSFSVIINGDICSSVKGWNNCQAARKHKKGVIQIFISIGIWSFKTKQNSGESEGLEPLSCEAKWKDLLEPLRVKKQKM